MLLELLLCGYQIGSVHLWLPLSGLGEIWMRMRRELGLELQMEWVSEFWIPSVELDQPLVSEGRTEPGALLSSSHTPSV